MAFEVGRLDAIGLINDSPSPATRVEVQDIHSDTEANFRQVPDRDTDPDGATIFSSFRSTMSFAAADIKNFSQAETWLTGYTPVKMVGVSPDLFYQWYTPTRIVPTQVLTPEEAALVKGEYAMTRDGGDQADHGVYVTRNGLLDLAPQNGGWADTNNDGTPDGYTESSLKSTAFSSGVYEAFVDTNSFSSGELKATIPFPIDGEDVTLSVEYTQLHDDGKNLFQVIGLDDSKFAIGTGVSTTVTSTGRKSITYTTPSGSNDTHFLQVLFKVTNATTETSKMKIKDPCLRVDGGTNYVAK